MISHKSRPVVFTLIEMLVVICIIGILAAMLMPSLQKALETSRRIGCSNNLKNIYLGFSTYITSNDGTLPYVANNDINVGQDNYSLEWVLSPYMGLSLPDRNWKNNFPVGNPLFICQSSPIRYDATKGYYIHGGEYSWNSRGINAYEGLFNNWVGSTACTASWSEQNANYLKLSSYKSPARNPYQFCSRRLSNAEPLIRISDGVTTNNTLAASSWHGDNAPPRPTVFFDGHAKTLTQFDYTNHGGQKIIKIDYNHKPEILVTEF